MIYRNHWHLLVCVNIVILRLRPEELEKVTGWERSWYERTNDIELSFRISDQSRGFKQEEVLAKTIRSRTRKGILTI